MDSLFKFKQFSVSNWRSALKVGTDAVVLGSLLELPAGFRFGLDIGTGTGVIALMVAQKIASQARNDGNRRWGVIGIDIDGASCEEAAENFANSPWAEYLRVEKLRLQDYKPTQNFDLIFSNPPYFENSLKNPDQRESTARHSDSLSFRDICAFCSEYLSEDGQFWVILPFDQMLNNKRIAASFGLKAYKQVTVYSTAKKPAKRAVLAFSRNATTLYSSELILNENGTHSPQYQALTADFLIS